MRSSQSIELWVLGEAQAECLTLIEVNGKHRLMRANYHLSEPPLLDKAAFSACSTTEFLQLLSASIARARREQKHYEIHWPEPSLRA